MPSAEVRQHLTLPFTYTPEFHLQMLRSPPPLLSISTLAAISLPAPHPLSQHGNKQGMPNAEVRRHLTLPFTYTSESCVPSILSINKVCA